ncbi:hypothetical protein [Pseudoxanthomonas sp.]|uniref:hypothetical protein n=1 Tax=Pseudoxanthomonas sp. TaxID=1871049 RepID=UPI003F80CF6C
MKTQMKLLDCTLIAILASLTWQAGAQDTTERAAAPQGKAEDPHQPFDCTHEACTSQEGLLFRLRSRSYDTPVSEGTSKQSSSLELQPDRRVTVAVEPPGQASALGKFSIQLPNGGAVWATEDPTLGDATLTVSAPSLVPFDGKAIVNPVRFYVRSNYSAFVQRYELVIYRAADADLIEPIATLPLTVGNVASAEWDGKLPGKYPFRLGDELVYVLRAYDAQGNFDETYPDRLQLVKPEEFERGARLLRDSSQKSLGMSLSIEQAQTRSLLDATFAKNGLRQQNIPLHGSRIRIQGRNLPDLAPLKINGESYPVDMERKFAAEYLVPVGRHRFEIAVGEGPAGGGASHALDVDVTGKYFFGVGLADVTFAKNEVSGSRATSNADVRYDDDMISDGRLAFYGKAKLRGKYLVTAQADTTEKDLEHLFDGFGRAYPQDIFRRLDPDLYYPVYGDDSSVYRDVDTMGRFYVRVDWDKNQALWGNYQTGIAGTEFAQYVRSLHGAALDWRSRGANPWGDPMRELRLFGSEAQSAPGHNEFIGTGGSLYYLRHTDILPGSDVVVVEVRDPTTGRIEERATLTRGADYEIDELQGRILLTRPLSAITRDNVSTLTRDTPLGGFEQRLLVDYEWIPSGFDPGDVAAGFRGKQWFGNHFAVGATYVDENSAGDDYSIAGADLTLQAGKGTYLKAEYTQTEASVAPVFFSDNGGLSFSRINDVTGRREGDAKAIEARANFKELGWTEQDWSAGAWWREVGAGYSTGRHGGGERIAEYGAEVLGQFTSNVGVYARFSKAERDDESLTQVQLTGEWRIEESRLLSGELRRVEERRMGGGVAGTLAALKYTQRLGTSVDLYGQAQFTVDDDGGRYADNDLYTLGAKYLFGDLSSVGAEASHGDRGDAATVNAEYRLGPENTIYGGYTYSTDATDYDPLFNPHRQTGWTLGQRWRLSHQVNLFNESQMLKERGESGLAHTFGMDFYPAQGWNLGFTLMKGELTNVDGGQVQRRAVSLNGGRTSPETDWQSKIEWRQDTGAERREQWVSTHRLTRRINDSWRIAARLNYSRTTDELDAAAGAKFIEGNVGFAYRPWNSVRWGLFGRYTYLYDLSTLGQRGGADYDQRTQVVSLEGTYKATARWEFAAKVARREGEVRHGRDVGDWADSTTDFAAVSARYDLAGQWHALAAYRWLDVKRGGSTRGALLGLDRDIGRNFRVGVGYSFTRFSDDLTDFDNDHKGWFINLTGRY